VALYVQQSYASKGGPGQRVSLRGGGPLVTLALPDGGNRQTTLWETLWLNTPADYVIGKRPERSFPWLAPCLTSKTGEVLHEKGADRAQAFFGTPRRMRLVFAENTERKACCLTGVVDDVVVEGFVRVPHGVNYGEWRHPLTPYKTKRDEKTKKVETSPVLTKVGRIGYLHWVGLVAGGEDRHPASAVLEAKGRLANLGDPWQVSSRLMAAGFAMGDASALQFLDTRMPLHTVDPDRVERIESTAKMMVDAASIVAGLLGKALWRARERSAPGEARFWADTEQAFHSMLDTVFDIGQPALAAKWLKVLKRSALRVFDDTVQPDDDLARAEAVVKAKTSLGFALNGYGSGKSLFRTLLLPLPAKKSKKEAA
jgi:CRISPR system Cascade subunit CasA